MAEDLPNSRTTGSRLLEIPSRLEVARTPTPIEHWKRIGSELGVDLWVKRDDLTGFELSGNKVRKLEFSFSKAIAKKCDAVLTCGGVDSNHCRATTFLARRVGLEPHLLLRTEDGRAPSVRSGNTLLNSIAGAKIDWVSREEYQQGRELLDRTREKIEQSGSRVFVIPEGASDALGALGFVAAAEELYQQEERLGVPFDFIVHAVGSGGTSAGLSAGRDALQRDWQIIGVPVCDDAAYFREKVTAIRSDLTERHHLPAEDQVLGEADRFLEGLQGRGYGLTTAEELNRYADLAMKEGALVDPCYTGKAYLGLRKAVAEGYIPAGSRVLFWHTGGAFANFSKSEDWQNVL